MRSICMPITYRRVSWRSWNATQCRTGCRYNTLRAVDGAYTLVPG